MPAKNTDEATTAEAPAEEVRPYPHGVFIGLDVEQTTVGDLGEFKVDPATGRITGKL